jgi:Pyridoxamine 5'-phosphate oxidase
MNTPVTSLDSRYSDPVASATTWADTQRAIESAELFWLSTVRTDGRPHVTPLVAVWVDDALHFTTGSNEQKAANLRANSNVILTTGRNDWKDGIDIVVEGEAREGAEQHVLELVSQEFRTKWDGGWEYVARDGKFFHPDGFEVQLFSVAPTKVLAFAKGTFGHTVHKFREE